MAQSKACKKYYDKNKEELCRKLRAYRLENGEKVREASRVYRKENKAIVNQKERAFYAKNKDRYSLWRINNKDELKKKSDKDRDLLGDKYLKSHLRKLYKLKTHEIPQALIDLKREQLNIFRINKKLKKGVKDYEEGQ